MRPRPVPPRLRRGPALRPTLATAAWATTYLLALVWGLSHPVPGARVSLVWPAAGVAVLWLLHEPGGPARRRAALLLALVALLGNRSQGVEWTASLLWAPVNLLHGLVGVAVVERLRGPASRALDRVQDLAVLLVASLAAGAASAVSGAAVATWRFDLPYGQAVELLTVRNAVSTLVVLAAGLGALSALDRAGVRGPAGALETAVVAVSVPVLTVVVVTELPPPLVFLLLPLTVWAAARAGLGLTSAVVLVQAVVVVRAVLGGSGPFAALDPMAAALAAQLLLAVLVLVGLCLSLAEQERRRAHAESASSRDRLQQNLDAALVGQATLLLPEQGPATLRAVNPSLARLLRRPGKQAVGTDLLALVDAQDRPALAAVLHALRRGERPGWQGEVRLRLVSDADEHDDLVWVEAVLGRVDTAAGDGEPVVVTAQFLDVTARKRAEEQLSHLALHDELTGLPNRALWRDRASQALAGSTRSGARVGVLYVDLDRFKQVNDEHGHEVGDGLLVEVAGRLTGAVRPQDTVARLGGDEFVVLCPDVPDPAALAAVSDRLLASLGPAVEVAGTRLTVTASIGTALSDGRGGDVQGLLRQADAALYGAKAAGRGRAEHSGAAEDERRRTVPLLDELSLALSRGELVVHHQPVVDLASGACVAVEALVRWQHPSRGLVGPAEWLDALELSDLIYAVGLHVLEQACHDGAGLQERFGPLGIHVNVSARQLDRPGLVEGVARALRRSGLPAGLLTLELTETRLLAVHGQLLQDLHALRALGVRLAADDVGTGYSTLSHLVEMPIDVLKLDRSFVAALGREQRATAVSNGVIAIARGLGIDCVAEGVEQQAQADELRALGYTTGQGWLWSPALAYDDLERWLERRAHGLPRPRAGEQAPLTA